MDKRSSNSGTGIVTRFGMSMQTKLIAIFLLVKIIPLILLCVLAWHQFTLLGDELRTIAVGDSAAALNASATKNIERMTTDTASRVAEFLYNRDSDIRYLASLPPDEAAYRAFIGNKRGRLIRQGRWELAPDGKSWIDTEKLPAGRPGVSTNAENNDMGGFHAIPRESFEYVDAPLYDEIAFIDPAGREVIKVVAEDSTKRLHRMNPEKRDVSRRENTFVKAETYFPRLKELKPDGIFVSDVIGAYVGSNFAGMYAPAAVAAAAAARGYPIEYKPEEQAYAGKENPNGRRFEGIVRWAAPVTGDDGEITGYVTFALNHDHIMEFVDHITPMDERYAKTPSAFEGNYAFIWDYQSRSICHPRHHSIVGFDPETGDPQVPWLESSIYNGWKAGGQAKWTDFVKDRPTFHEQSRQKRPAPELTRAGLIGLDGRYLDNAPQCTGWMDLTKDGGSGSFYILWSGLYKLNTAAAIPYYTGQYAPSPANGNSRRGFGFVAIGSELDYFTMPARETEARLVTSIDINMRGTAGRLIVTTLILTTLVVLIAVWMAWGISRPIRRMAGHMTHLAQGELVSGEGLEVDLKRRDEIGMLANSLNDLTLARRDEIILADTLARGDYTRSLPLRSDMDVLGKAFNAMIRINKQALSQVNQTVSQVANGATSVSDVAVSLSQGAQTSESVQRTIAAAVDMVDREARDTAVHAREANQLAIASRDAAHRGYQAVFELTESMDEIERAGNQIASVVKLIDDIAFQTNLLALNAAVEASRAGRQGKGFSVVAAEVRNLASRSAKAAHETSDMVASMLELMGAGTRLAKRSDSEFHEIVDTTDKAAQLFENISHASNAQSAAITEIVASLEQINAVIQENSNNAQEMSSAAGVLSRQAEELNHMISRFRLDAPRERGPAAYLE